MLTWHTSYVASEYLVLSAISCLLTLWKERTRVYVRHPFLLEKEIRTSKQIAQVRFTRFERSFSVTRIFGRRFFARLDAAGRWGDDISENSPKNLNCSRRSFGREDETESEQLIDNFTGSYTFEVSQMRWCFILGVIVIFVRSRQPKKQR